MKRTWMKSISNPIQYHQLHRIRNERIGTSLEAEERSNIYPYENHRKIYVPSLSGSASRNFGSRRQGRRTNL